MEYRRVIQVFETPEPPEFTEEEILDACCGAGMSPPPKCRTKIRKWRGYDEAEIRRLYNIDPAEPIKIILEGPKSGICGKKTEIYELPDKGCCEDVTPLVYDTDNSVEVMTPGGYGLVHVLDGRLPIYWSLSGTGVHFKGGKKDAVSGTRSIRIFSDSSFCGTAVVRAHDKCTAVKGYVRSTVGQWVKIGSIRPEQTYDPEAHGYFKVTWSGYGCATCSTWYMDPCEKVAGPYKIKHVSCTCGWSLWAKCGEGNPMPTIDDGLVNQFTVHVFQGWALWNDGVNCGGGDYEVMCHSNTWEIYKWGC